MQNAVSDGPAYRHWQTGDPVDADDPQRGIWYGVCSFWTDDWNQLLADGVPRCPECGSPGFITSAERWLEEIARFSRTNAEYEAFVRSLKGTCRGPGVSMGDAWEAHQKRAPSRRNRPADRAEQVREAYEWAGAQQYQSVAARHARTLAAELTRLRCVIAAKLHRRKCRDCGHVGYYADAVRPCSLCEKCRSQDTRPVREPSAEVRSTESHP